MPPRELERKAPRSVWATQLPASRPIRWIVRESREANRTDSPAFGSPTPLQPFPNPDMDAIIRHAPTTTQPSYFSDSPTPSTPKPQLNHNPESEMARQICRAFALSIVRPSVHPTRDPSFALQPSLSCPIHLSSVLSNCYSIISQPYINPARHLNLNGVAYPQTTETTEGRSREAVAKGVQICREPYLPKQTSRCPTFIPNCRIWYNTLVTYRGKERIFGNRCRFICNRTIIGQEAIWEHAKAKHSTHHTWYKTIKENNYVYEI